MQQEAVALAGRARQRQRLGEIGAGAGGVVAQVIRRLAHLRQRRRDRPPAFADDERHQRRPVAFVEFGGALEDRGALGGRKALPDRSGARRGGERRLDGRGIGGDRRADLPAPVGGIEHRLAAPGDFRAADDRRGAGRLAQRRRQAIAQLAERMAVGEVDARRVRPLGPIEVARQRDVRMGFRLQPGELGDRVGGDRGDRLALVDDTVDERGVGAVFQQPPHQIGEQILVAADRRVDPARQAHRADDLLVKRLAHAVQALEFPVLAFAGKLQHRRQRLRVVGGELRIERRAGVEEAPGAGQVRHVRRDLAGVDGIGREAAFLRAFDLAVPIGALDEAQHQPASGLRRQIGEPVDHRRRALLIGLHREAESVPAGERGHSRQRLDEIERQFEPVGFLGVDGEADPGMAGPFSQIGEARQQFAHHPLALGELVARVQRRQLDRDSRRRLDLPSAAGPADGGDRLGIGLVVAPGVGRGFRRLAEHVVGMPVAVALGGGGAVERLADRAAHDELAPQDAHCRQHRLTHHRLARAGDEAVQGMGEFALAGVVVQHPPGQHQGPGRGVDEDRAGMAEMALPIGGGDLVADQPVDRVAVGDAQQRLGEAHQRHPLGRRQRVFVQEGVDPAMRRALVAHRGDEAARGRLDAAVGGGRQLGGGEDQRIGGGFVAAVGRLDRRAQPGLGRRRGGEDEIHAARYRRPPVSGNRGCGRRCRARRCRAGRDRERAPAGRRPIFVPICRCRCGRAAC